MFLKFVQGIQIVKTSPEAEAFTFMMNNFSPFLDIIRMEYGVLAPFHNFMFLLFDIM